MATISGYDSSSLSVLFSSLNKGNSLGNSMTDLLGINYSDYATIRNGSYHKLLRSYYSINSSDEVKKIVNNDNEKDDDNKKTESSKESASTSTSTSKETADTISKIESTAEELRTSADKLLETGKTAVFASKEVTDEAGNVTEQYDTDKIYKAVSEFVTNYNAVLDQTLTAKSDNIVSAAERMTRITGYNEESLSKIGITIGEDKKLKIDEEAFKAADVEGVKKVFNSKTGFAYQVDSQASMIAYYAENEASKANTYTNSGTYANNYNTGTMYSEGI